MTANPISNFDFNSNTIRVVEIEGEPWFVAADACRALGLSNITTALQNINPIEVIRMKLSEGRGPSNKLISESGL